MKITVMLVSDSGRRQSAGIRGCRGSGRVSMASKAMMHFPGCCESIRSSCVTRMAHDSVRAYCAGSSVVSMVSILPFCWVDMARDSCKSATVRSSNCRVVMHSRTGTMVVS